MTTQALARKALAAACVVRLEHSLPLESPVCVYDLAEKMGLDVRFQPVPSLEGVYVPGKPPLVILSSLRPSGRQRVNCGHELGHHVFGHGLRIDELLEPRAHNPRFDPQEFLANCFAEFVLMPQFAVLAAFRSRNIAVDTATPVEMFRVSTYFGVGYGTLLHHLERNLGLLQPSRADALRRTAPRSIQASLSGSAPRGELFFADCAWTGRPLDLHVGDTLLVPSGTVVEGGRLTPRPPRADVDGYEASLPGIGRLESPDLSWTCFVRVARRGPNGNYVGRAIYRHDETEDDDR